jgi:hypothetical protein
MCPRLLDDTLFAATASAKCSLRTLDDVLCLESFCGPSRGPIGRISSVLQRGFVLRNAVFRNLHGGQNDDTTTYRHWDS